MPAREQIRAQFFRRRPVRPGDSFIGALQTHRTLVALSRLRFRVCDLDFDYKADLILGKVLDYWKRKRSSRAMPSRRDIDPTEIPHLLPHLQLIDVAEGGQRFRYRLVGTTLVQTFGREYTGLWLDQLFAGARAKFAGDIYRKVCELRRPLFVRNGYLTSKGLPLVANRLYLPLSADGTTVNMLMGALTFESTSAIVAGAWGEARMTETIVTEVVEAPSPE